MSLAIEINEFVRTNHHPQINSVLVAKEGEVIVDVGIRALVVSPIALRGGGGTLEECQSNLTAREMLSIGQLYLNDGIYEGKQIISKEYIKQCVSPSKCDPGYGYMWWLGTNWYGCRGFGGQNISVFPKEKVVFVMQATPTNRPMGYDDVFRFVQN